MKNLLRTEELAQFVLCLLVLSVRDAPWWCYPLLIIGPDIGMLGYLINNRVGAFTYNVLHHKGIAVFVAFAGWVVALLSAHAMDGASLASGLFITAIILYGHASMDRIFGYGLKFSDSFHHTHLGWIGKLAQGTVREE